jgi:hypothetical protein
MDEENPSADRIADAILGQAIRLDLGQPKDDMTIAVLRILAMGKDQIRRLSVRLPVPPVHEE